MVCASCCSTTACTRASMEVTRVSPARPVDLTRVAEHAAHRVDGDPLVARAAAEVLVVLLLQPGPADDRRAVHRVVALVLGLVELLDGDRAEVAEHVRGVDAVRRGVGADALRLDQHRREVLALLHDRDRDLLTDVLGDRHRLVGRAVPAGALRSSRRSPHSSVALAELPPRHVDRAWTAGSSRRRAAACACILCSSVRSTLTTHEVRLATSGRPMSSTIRPRAGCTTTSRTDCSAAWAW